MSPWTAARSVATIWQATVLFVAQSIYNRIGGFRPEPHGGLTSREPEISTKQRSFFPFLLSLFLHSFLRLVIRRPSYSKSDSPSFRTLALAPKTLFLGLDGLYSWTAHTVQGERLSSRTSSHELGIFIFARDELFRRDKK